MQYWSNAKECFVGNCKNTGKSIGNIKTRVFCQPLVICQNLPNRINDGNNNSQNMLKTSNNSNNSNNNNDNNNGNNTTITTANNNSNILKTQD